MGEGPRGCPWWTRACALCEKRVLEFRMRAMLVSFLTHHMNHRWQDGVEHLARCFLTLSQALLSQFQMQAGVTGINTVRIYNPVTREDHDPTG